VFGSKAIRHMWRVANGLDNHYAGLAYRVLTMKKSLDWLMVFLKAAFVPVDLK
jgi:hypothetical protein